MRDYSTITHGIRVVIITVALIIIISARGAIETNARRMGRRNKSVVRFSGADADVEHFIASFVGRLILRS